jgi:hypothetical protein
MTTFSADLRAAAVDLLKDFADSVVGTPPDDHPAVVGLSVYRARPVSIQAPHAFVDGIREGITYYGPTTFQRNPTVDVIVCHALFDSGDAADQRDRFVDGFLSWVAVLPHAAGANTTVGIEEVEDLPDYVPDWLPPAQRKTYYATRFGLRGLALE